MPEVRGLNVTQKYARRLVDAVENEVAFGRYLIAERLLHQFFVDRLTEFEKEVDEIIPAAEPAKDVAEVKTRSKKQNMKVPQEVN
jgi:hypothetical protein